MKALILGAGQGRRLLPMTATAPKCTLPILDRSVIEWQIDELSILGIDRVTVVVGYGADQVERLLVERYGPNRAKLINNPDFAVSDNLVSCWMAQEEMNEDFILLNGDTLFEAPVIRMLLDKPVQPVRVVIDHKTNYDADDMKVTLDGERLVDIGKDLQPDKTHAESAGIILFRGEGPSLFREALENALKEPSARKKWYLSVIKKMSESMPVWTCSIKGLHWCEIDFPADLKTAKNVVKECMCLEKQIRDSLQGVGAPSVSAVNGPR